MTKFTLNIESDYEYEMIGLCSHNQDYRIIWELNHHLGLSFIKSDDDYLNYSKKTTVVSNHSMYLNVEDQNESPQLIVIKNKANGSCIIPELAQIDYFMFIHNDYSFDRENWMIKCRNMPSVLTAFYFIPQDYRSCEQLIIFE
jgi:hypothetical protein